jgi:uncharacterized protein
MSASRFVWYELMTPDVAGAAAFYSDVVGWQAQDSGMPGVDYTLLKVGDARTAGLMALPAELKAIGMPPGWRGYVAVDDVDASEAKLVQLGGKVLRPAGDIPGVGRFASVTDPQGGAFVLFKPAPTEPPPIPPADAPGITGWQELHALDGSAVFDFYATLFGWTKGEAFDMGTMGTYQLFEIDGVPAGAVMTKRPDAPAPGWRCYFRVDSIAAAARRIAQSGGAVTMGPEQVPDGQWMLCGSDPQGAQFALISKTK